MFLMDSFLEMTLESVTLDYGTGLKVLNRRKKTVGIEAFGIAWTEFSVLICLSNYDRKSMGY